MDDILAHKALVGYLGDDVLSIAQEHDYVVDIRTIAHVLLFLEVGAKEALLAVNVQLLVGHHHLGCLYHVEAADLGLTLASLTVLLTDILEVGDGVLD